MNREGWQRWVLPGFLGVVVAAVLLAWLIDEVRLKPPKASPASAAVPPAIAFVTPAKATHDKDGLFDLEPLFLPTQHNTSVLSLPVETKREPGSMSFTYPAKFTISESAGGVPLTDPIAVPSRPVEVLNVGFPPNPWPEVGRANLDLMVLDHRMAYVEVQSSESGQTLIAEAVFAENSVKPPAQDWSPLEFVVAVDAAGLVGAPVATNSTTSDEVETFFQNFLVKQFQLGARLHPGFYMVTIGP